MKGLDNLKILRERKGLTQAELADMLYTTAQSVSRWENGLSEPDIDTLCRIADIFEVRVDTLLSRDYLSKEEFLNEIMGYLRKSESFADSVFEILRVAVSSKLGGNYFYNTYSYIVGKESIVTFSNRNDTPKLSVVADGLTDILNFDHFEYTKYLSAFSNENVIHAISKFQELDVGVDYDRLSLIQKLGISQGVFDSTIKNLELLGLIQEYVAGINGEKITMYRKLWQHRALCVYALVRQLFMCKSDGGALELNRRS